MPSLEELADSESPLNSEGFNSDKNKHSDVNTGTSSTRVRKVFPSDSVQQSPKPRLSLVDLIANSPKIKRMRMSHFIFWLLLEDIFEEER